jgi:riboflavin kinase/FMN adenylyltransferase
MMRVIESLSSIRKSGKPIVLAAGFFDGVHRGHQKVLKVAQENARRIGGQAWVMTFAVHPMKILNPRKRPPLITCTEHKLKIFDEMNMDACFLYPFKKSTASMSAIEFLGSLTENIKPLSHIVVGKNWRFGKGGHGNTRGLSKFCAEMGFGLSVVNAVVRGGQPVSSTRIRKDILHGDFRDAEKMLGRPVSVFGTVVRGKRMARGLGFPTANLHTEDEILPPFGVYAVMVYLDKKTRPGVLNFGTRPTFSRGAVSRPVLEIHIMGYDGDIYGKGMEVFFVEKLRNEKKFASQDELKTQIDLDVRLASAVLGK